MPNNITWIIGNGFDVQLGLETEYKKFYKWYCDKEKDTDTEAVKSFKKRLKEDNNKDIDTWADFELAYGKYSNDCQNNASDYSVIKADVEEQLGIYLREIQESIDWSKLSDNHRDMFAKSMINWISEIKKVKNDFIYNKLNNNRGLVNFLQFNYTNTLHRLLDESQDNITTFIKASYRNTTWGTKCGVRQVGTVRYVHGNLGGQIILGVDNVSQIVNKDFHNNPDIISEIVKPNQLSDIQNRDLNNVIPAEYAKQDINNSSIICVFGASIEATDKTWWKIIADWLKDDNKLLIIFNYEGSKPESDVTRELNRVKKLKDKFTNDFIDSFRVNADWDNETYESNKDKIIVTLNENLFNFKLPRIKTDISKNDGI